MLERERLSTADFVSKADKREAEAKRDTGTKREIEVRDAESHEMPRGGAGAAMEPAPSPLLNEGVARELRARWDQIQTGFVDEPRAAVKQADELVAQAMKRLAETFTQEREGLERQWDRGDQVNTEDLRLALRKYRSFFQRLLTV